MLSLTPSAQFGLSEATGPFPAKLIDLYDNQVDLCLKGKPYGVDRPPFYTPPATRCACERTIIAGPFKKCLFEEEYFGKLGVPQPAPELWDRALLETLDKQISDFGPGVWFTNPQDRYKLASILSKIALYWRGMGSQGAKSPTEDLARRQATEQLRLYRDSTNQILLLITFSDMLHGDERDTQTLISAIKGVRDVLLKAGPQEIPFDVVTTALSRLREHASELEPDEKVRAAAVQAMAQIAQAGSAGASTTPPIPTPSRTSGHLVAAAAALVGIGALFYFTRQR